jgi:hypothetical protein
MLGGGAAHKIKVYQMQFVCRAAVMATAAFLISAPVTAGATVIFSENFSGAAPGTHGTGTLSGTGFAVTGGNIDIIGVLNGSFFTCVQNLPGNCIDMVGSGANGQITSTVTFNLLANHLYTYSFDHVLQGFGPTDPNTSKFTFDVGGVSIVEYTSTGAGAGIGAGFVSPIDVANAVLIITSTLAADGSHGSVISNIVLNDEGLQPTETPVPGALPLFASGVGALGLLRWRRKRKAATPAA